jgi:DHA1 family tetracycline resistance protein-like MFS transporter
MRNQTRKVLIPYSIVILLAYIGFALPLPILPEMFFNPERSILAGETVQKKMILLGLVMASFPLGQFFGSPFLGRLSDRFGRKKVILLSLSGTTIGYLITATAVSLGSILGMFFGLALCGFCEGNVTIAQSVVADLTEAEGMQTEKAVHFGWINIFIALGFIVGPLMGGQLADPTVVSWFTFATPFWVAACMTVIGMGVIYLYSQETLKEKPKEKWQFFGTLWESLKRPNLKKFYVANFFLALGYFSFFRFFPVFLERRFQFTPSQLSYIMVYDSLAIAAGVIWLIPFLSKRLKPIQSLSLFSFLLAVTFVICLIPESPYSLLFTLPFLGLCLAAVITNGSLLISNTASSLFQGQAMGTLTSVQVLAEIFTGLAGGPLAAFTMTLPLYIGAAMAVVCSLILFHSIRRERSTSVL